MERFRAVVWEYPYGGGGPYSTLEEDQLPKTEWYSNLDDAIVEGRKLVTELSYECRVHHIEQQSQDDEGNWQETIIDLSNGSTPVL